MKKCEECLCSKCEIAEDAECRRINCKWCTGIKVKCAFFKEKK